MIKSKKDLIYFLEADRIALRNLKRNHPGFLGDEVWKFQILLRKLEYYMNCKRNFLNPLFWITRIRRHSLGIKLGFTIPPNVFGPGLCIVHRGTIIVNDTARVGSNCRIHAGVNIGASKLGNNIYIGPGAKIFPRVEISDNIAIGANSVVNKSFRTPGISIAGGSCKKDKWERF